MPFVIGDFDEGTKVRIIDSIPVGNIDEVGRRHCGMVGKVNKVYLEPVDFPIAVEFEDGYNNNFKLEEIAEIIGKTASSDEFDEPSDELFYHFMSW